MRQMRPKIHNQTKSRRRQSRGPMNTPPAKPEKEFAVGGIRVAIWSNPRIAQDGQAFDAHRIVIERTYKDPSGNFQKADTLSTNDIPKAILALKKAFEYLTMPDRTRNEKTEPEQTAFVTPRIP